MSRPHTLSRTNLTALLLDHTLLLRQPTTCLFHGSDFMISRRLIPPPPTPIASTFLATFRLCVIKQKTNFQASDTPTLMIQIGLPELFLLGNADTELLVAVKERSFRPLNAPITLGPSSGDHSRMQQRQAARQSHQFRRQHPRAAKTKRLPLKQHAMRHIGLSPADLLTTMRAREEGTFPPHYSTPPPQPQMLHC
jgi:hypothetical protein